MIEISNNTLSSTVRVTTSGSESDMMMAEELKKKLEESVDIEMVIATLPPTIPPTLPPIILSSISYSYLIHQSISLIIDMNDVYECDITPPLPQGLIFNSSSCSISGSISSLSSSSHTITSISDSNTLIRIISIEVISSLISYPQTNLIIAQGQFFSLTPSLTRSVIISVVSGSLPSGLSIDSSSGIISGSPSQTVSYQPVAVSGMSGTAIQTIVLLFTVLIPISSFSYPKSSYLLSNDEYYSVSPIIEGTNPVYSITSGSLPSGLSIDSLSGIISGTPSQSVSSYLVTIKAYNQLSDKSTTLSFTVLQSISSFSYSQSSYVILKDSPFSIIPSITGDNLSFSIISGFLPTGLSLNSSSGMISGIPSQSISSQSVIIKAFNEVNNFSVTLSFTVLTPITSFSYPSYSYIISVHDTFSATPSINGDQPFFSIIDGSLPQGLSLNSTSGMISGSPSQSLLSHSVMINALNGVSNQSFTISFTVLIPISSFSYPQSSYLLAKDESISITPSFNGDQILFSLISGSLPQGLSIDSSTGVISGSSSQSLSSQSVTIKAFNEISDQSFTILFSVLIPISSFSYPQSSIIIPRDEYYSVSPIIQGTDPSYSITSGSLPQGLSIDSSSGVISGIPSQSVSSRLITIKAHNEISDQSFSLSFTVLISPSSLFYQQSVFIIPNNTYFYTSPHIQGDNLSFSIID